MLHFARPSRIHCFTEPNALDAIAARLAPSIRRAFLEAARLLGVPDALAALPEFESALLEKLLPLLSKGMADGAAQALATLQVPLRFDLKNAAVQTWIDEHSATLVKQISDDTRAGIRAILSRGYADGLTPFEQGKQIRSIVGLTERQANAVANYRAGLIDAGRKPAQAESLTERYSAKQLRFRANLIATNESNTAANRGQRAAWNQSAEAGFIDRVTTRRVWIASSDACPECEPLDGEEVAFDDEFDEGDPPIHVGCRCSVGLAFE
jgi:hypothetical protein